MHRRTVRTTAVGEAASLSPWTSSQKINPLRLFVAPAGFTILKNGLASAFQALIIGGGEGYVLCEGL
jgi:hypothetical protein